MKSELVLLGILAGLLLTNIIYNEIKANEPIFIPPHDVPSPTPELEESQPTPTPTPTPTPLPTPTPKLIDKLDPKQIEHVYFFYADTPADEEALKVAKLLSKYVNVTFCKVVANGSEIDMPLRKEYMECARVMDAKFLDEDPNCPKFATPSMVVTIKNFDYDLYGDKYIHEYSGKYIGKPNYLCLGYTGNDNVNAYILFYWGTNESYTVPMSVDWFYAQITGKFLKPPAYAKKLYHSYDKESENVTALTLGPNYIPEPIKPLNPNDVKLVILAELRGINDDYFVPILNNYAKRIKELIPHAKFVRLIYWWADNGSITSNPPGYEYYWEKYVIPYAKFYDPNEKSWKLALDCVILIMKNCSHKTYAGVDSYKDYFEVVRSTGYSVNPSCTYPPIDKLFLDIQAYYNQIRENSTKTN